MSNVVNSAMNSLTTSEISVQMIFSPQNCTLDLLDKTLTSDRRSLADSILGRIEDSLKMKAASYHLIIGPRGSGKTQVLAFIRKKLEAGTPLQIIRLSEEERGITNLLDFLLACFRAAGIPGKTAVDRIRSGNPAAYKDAATDYFKNAAIDYFCEITNGKSALIIIENLSNLFDGLEESAISDLRGFFQEHPFVSLIASSTDLFTDSSKADHPFYGFFSIHPLEQLSRSNARKYLLALAREKDDKKLVALLQNNQALAQARVNAIYDLTGGNHRLLAMLNIFLTADGLDELVDPFIQMADRELTPYYQQRLDQLAPQQNKLLQTIANHHGRALNVNEIAHLTFLPSTTVSRQLYDLLHGGYVIRKQVGRESCYELREPLLRLVLDLKEGRDRPLPIIVNLLRNWYDVQELQQMEKTAPEHARCYYQAALGGMLYGRAGDFEASLEVQADMQGRIQEAQATGDDDLFEEGLKLFQEDNYTAALGKFEQLLKLNPQNGLAWSYRADALRLIGHKKESLKAYNEVTERFDRSDQPALQEAVARAFTNKGAFLEELEQYEEAIKVFNQVVERFGGSDQPALQKAVAKALFNKGYTLGQLERYEEAIKVYEQVVERFGGSDQPELQEQVARALVNKGASLEELEQYEEAIKVYDQVVKRFDESDQPELQEQVARALVNKGYTLVLLRQYKEAIKVYEQVVKRFGESDQPELQNLVAKAFINKGYTLVLLRQYEEAMKVYEQVAERFGGSDQPELQEPVARALYSKGNLFILLKRYAESLPAFTSALQLQPDHPYALAGKIEALIHLNQADNALQSLSDMLKKVPASHDIRKTLVSDLINLLLHDEPHLKQVIEIYQDDQNSLMAGLILWIQNQLPLSKSDAEKLEPAYLTLSSAFGGAIPEAEQAIQMFQAARLDAMGDPKALLSLPIELRRLIERVKDES